LVRDDARSGDVLEREVLLGRDVDVDDDDECEWRETLLWRDWAEDEVEVEVSVLLRVRDWRTGAGEARVRARDGVVGEGVRARRWRCCWWWCEDAISSRSSRVNAVVCSAGGEGCAGFGSIGSRGCCCCGGSEGSGDGAVFEAPM
jgi:hypothetical protein